jgi:hypothetical protein
MTTTQQRANLRQLADFLEDNADKLIAFHEFRMDDFRQSLQPTLVDGEVVDLQALGCGTAACAAGWAATLPNMRPLPEDFGPRGYLDWSRYIVRVFGDLDDDLGLWQFCFGGYHSDNPRAAAFRLRTAAGILDHKANGRDSDAA